MQFGGASFLSGPSTLNFCIIKHYSKTHIGPTVIYLREKKGPFWPWCLFDVSSPRRPFLGLPAPVWDPLCARWRQGTSFYTGAPGLAPQERFDGAPSRLPEVSGLGKELSKHDPCSARPTGTTAATDAAAWRGVAQSISFSSWCLGMRIRLRLVGSHKRR